MPASAWVQHVKKYYADRKKKDKAYKYSSAMKDARATYKSAKAGKSKPAKDDDEKAPPKKAKAKRKRAPKKSKAPKRPPRDVAEPEAPAKKKKKPKRKRPGVPSDFTNLN